jgi:hypothetical protein
MKFHDGINFGLLVFPPVQSTTHAGNPEAGMEFHMAGLLLN